MLALTSVAATMHAIEDDSPAASGGVTAASTVLLAVLPAHMTESCLL